MRILLILLALFLIDLKSNAQVNSFLFIEHPAMFNNKDINSFTNDYIVPKLSIPDSIKNKCIKRNVIATFVVDTIGYIKDIEIKKSYNDNLDNQVIGLIKLSSGLWQSASQNAKKLNQLVQISVPIITIKRDCPSFIDLIEQSDKFYKKGNFIESIGYLNKIIELYPNDTSAMILRAKCKLQLMDYSGACNDLKLLNTEEAKALMIKNKCK